MQSKRFDVAEVAVIPTLTGINTLVIENQDEHRINFHGIRYVGRIHKEATDPSIFQNGYVTLLCVPNDFIPTTGIFNNNDMEAMNDMIIGILPWSIYTGANNDASSATFYEFSITPKTSRTCSKGGKILGQVTNEGLGSVVVNALLSTFSTTV